MASASRLADGSLTSSVDIRTGLLDAISLDYDDGGDAEGQTDSDKEGQRQHNGSSKRNPYSNEIIAHGGTKVLGMERSFDARISFVHFAPHSMRDVIPGRTDFCDGSRARNFMRYQLGWYESDAAALLRKFLRSRPFVALSMLSIFVALFLSDLFVFCQVPRDMELDVILTCALLFFLVELITLSASEASYPLGFFFWMDVIGTASMVFDISFMFGPSAEIPDRLSGDTGTHSNVIIARAARAARLGARAGRLSRVAKILRFLNVGHESSGNDEAQQKMSKVISMKLSDVLSIRIAFLVICVAVILPAMRMLQYPLMDESMVAWTGMIASDIQELHLRVEQQPTAARTSGTAVARQRLGRELMRFASFYDEHSYGPFRVCFGDLAHSGHVDAICTGTTTREMPLKVDFYMPQRRSSVLELSNGGLHVFFNMSRPQRGEAAMGMISILFVILVMVFMSVSLTSTIAGIALTPLERMLAVVRERCAQIFKYTNMFESMDANGAGSAAEEDREDANCSSEFELLEKAVSKLAAIVHLSAAPTQPEIKKNMDEKDLMVLNWTQHQQAVVAPTTNVARKTMRRAGPIHTVEAEEPGEAQSAVLRKVPKETTRVLKTDLFDALSVPENLKQYVAAYIIYYGDGNYEYTQSVVSENRLQTFIGCSEKNYPANPFHNFSHAMDVAYELSNSFKQIESDRFFSEETQFWLLIAAIGHDLGHLGVNNSFLIESSHELAVMYNDRSPLENMHCSKLFQIVSQPDANVFDGMSRETYKEIRKGIIAAILHTDVTKHNEMVKELNLLYQMHSDAFEVAEQGDLADEVLTNHGQMMANVLLHCADIGNPMKPWDLCHKYAYLCIDEFFAQGDSEKQLGIPVGMLNDRDKVNRPNSQIGFIEFMIAPYVEALVLIFPHLRGLAVNLGINLKNWVDTWVEEASPPEEIVEKVRTRMSKTVLRLQGAQPNAQEQ